MQQHNRYTLTIQIIRVFFLSGLMIATACAGVSTPPRCGSSQAAGLMDFQPTAVLITALGDDEIKNTAVSASFQAQIQVCHLVLEAGSGIAGVITLRNTSAYATALNVHAVLPTSWTDVTQDASQCMQLMPGQTCQLRIIPGSQTHAATEIMIRGRNTSLSSILVSVVSPGNATITATPAALTFVEGSSGVVTVTNSAISTASATNVVAAIPGGSNISVQSTTCGAALAIGASCTITLASSTQEGPTAIPVAGSNTNTVNVDVTVVNQPIISIIIPSENDRIIEVGSAVPLSLVIENSAASAVSADAITAVCAPHNPCDDVSIDDSDCLSVAPGASCTLQLTSTTPYQPYDFIVSGSNTTSLTTRIAFYYFNGLVFRALSASGEYKVIRDTSDGAGSWTGTSNDIAGASSLSDGASNTNAIVADFQCTNDVGNCAAQICRDLGADWYLPALDELQQANFALCAPFSTPCFGNFSGSYWSSSQNSSNNSQAWYRIFSSGFSNSFPKGSPFQIRCVRNFPPP